MLKALRLYPLSSFVCVLIIGFSFSYYAPVNFVHFLSDQALHVLMADDFELPRDFYYWGQDRLGSLMPMVTYPIIHITGMAPVLAISVVLYAFLLTGFLIFSRYVDDPWLQVAACSVIFLPVGEYHHLMLIGHPYASQFFCGAIFIYGLVKLTYSVSDYEAGKSTDLKPVLYSTIATIFYFLGVWVSEFNLIMALIPGLYVWFDSDFRNRLRNLLISGRLRNVIYVNIILILLGIFFLWFAKQSAVLVTSGDYNRLFISSKSHVFENLGFLNSKLFSSLLFTSEFPVTSIFSWLVVIAIIVTFYSLFISKESVKEKNNFEKSLFITVIVAGVILFFSHWVYKSHFRVQYFTPLYLMFFFAFFRVVAQAKIEWPRVVVTSLMLLCSVIFCFSFVIDTKEKKPVKMYSEFSKLPSGTLIADYWDVYRIVSFSGKNLKALPFEYNTVRNFDWKEEALSEPWFYFIDSQFPVEGGVGDTIYHYGYRFASTGKKFMANGITVYQYTKFDSIPIRYFKLRSLDQGYIARDPATGILSASSYSKGDAVMLEMINVRTGIAIGADNGRYVEADFSGEKPFLKAVSTTVSQWEQFHICYAGPSRIHLKTHTWKFVSADKGEQGQLIANRDTPREWETFEIEIIR